jgi:hypothetical protein
MNIFKLLFYKKSPLRVQSPDFGQPLAMPQSEVFDFAEFYDTLFNNKYVPYSSSSAGMLLYWLLNKPIPPTQLKEFIRFLANQRCFYSKSRQGYLKYDDIFTQNANVEKELYLFLQPLAFAEDVEVRKPSYQ